MGPPKKPSLNPSRERSLKQWRPLIKQSRSWITSSQGKPIQYREQSNLACMLLIKSQLLDEPLNLDELMRYPVPPSLGTPDGFFGKTNKASMLHFLLVDTPEVPYPRDAIHIQDGMGLLYVLRHSVTFALRC